MEGMNKVLLLGHLGADPELRHTAGGTAVLSLRLATTEVWFERPKDGSGPGEKQTRTEWHNVTLFGPRATSLARLLSKGAPVLVEGGLRTSSYDKEGQKVWRTEVVARDVYLLGQKPKAEGANAGNGRARSDDTLETDALPF